MAYFVDLTPYEYGGTKPKPNIVNVGWLSAEHPFERGMTDAEFVDSLRILVRSPVNLYRGHHHCEYCPAPRVVIRGGLRLIDESTEAMGNGEIRVVGTDGTTYVAPVLILHYVIEHGYLPPQPFIDAVKRSASNVGAIST